MHWNVIVTRPRFEKQVAQCLSHLEVECYLPLRRELRQWHDRKKWVEIPLFNNYLFVRLPEGQRNRVFEAPGVLHYLRNGQGTARLHENEIARVKEICLHTGEISIAEHTAEIRVSSGGFEGYKGKLEQKNGKSYIKVTLPGISKSVWLKVTG